MHWIVATWDEGRAAAILEWRVSSVRNFLKYKCYGEHDDEQARRLIDALESPDTYFIEFAGVNFIPVKEPFGGHNSPSLN